MAAILLVEDNEADVHLTLRAAKKAGFADKLEVARDGESALKRLRREPPHESDPPIDLVYLDFSLPRMSGQEVLREIKSDERVRHIPVVVLSGSSDPKDVRAAYDLQAAAFITKPPDMSGLVGIVQGMESFWVELVTFVE